MAKRANPFIEDFVPQSKVHVGIKQFNNNEDRLKKVYEKTLLLLFNGAKKSTVQDAANGSAASLNNKEKMKQLVIGKDGTLVHSDTKILVADKTAAICACGSAAVESMCAYCEQRLCSSCQHTCERCQRPHCSHCSLTGSEGTEVCVSCYG